jgi:hypothetical protein
MQSSLDWDDGLMLQALQRYLQRVAPKATALLMFCVDCGRALRRYDTDIEKWPVYRKKLFADFFRPESSLCLRSFDYDTPAKEDRLSYEYLVDMRARALKQLMDDYCSNFQDSNEYDEYETKKREFDDTHEHFTSGARESAPLARVSNLFMPSTDETTVLQAQEISWGDQGQKARFFGRPSQSAPSISRLSCKCGYLLLADKKSKMRQRWCVLKPTTMLYYYDTENDSTPKGVVDLECYNLVERVDSGYGVEAKAPWRFCVRAPATMKQRGGKSKVGGLQVQPVQTVL